MLGIPRGLTMDTIGPRKVIRASLVLFLFLVIFPTIYSGVGSAKADSVIATIHVGVGLSAIDGSGATVRNGGSTLSTSIQFKFTGTNSVSIEGFECSLDRTAFSPCSSPVTLTNLLAGSHIFQVRAVDTLGNRDPTPATFTWSIPTPARQYNS